MRICPEHWEMIRASVRNHGMDALGAKSGEAAMERIVANLQGGKDAPSDFDPNMSHHWHWTNNALKAGGLYLMGQKEDGTEYCPICEFVAHCPGGFDAKQEIDAISAQMQAWCREQGLIPKVQ